MGPHGYKPPWGTMGAPWVPWGPEGSPWSPMAPMATHRLITAMHHDPYNRQRVIKLSVLTLPGPGKFFPCGINFKPLAPFLMLPFCQFL